VGPGVDRTLHAGPRQEALLHSDNELVTTDTRNGLAFNSLERELAARVLIDCRRACVCEHPERRSVGHALSRGRELHHVHLPMSDLLICAVRFLGVGVSPRAIVRCSFASIYTCRKGLLDSRASPISPRVAGCSNTRPPCERTRAPTHKNRSFC
jgi:hypothetical protein